MKHNISLYSSSQSSFPYSKSQQQQTKISESSSQMSENLSPKYPSQAELQRYQDHISVDLLQKQKCISEDILSAEQIKEFLHESNHHPTEESNFDETIENQNRLERILLKQTFLQQNHLFDPSEYFGGLKVPDLNLEIKDARLQEMFKITPEDHHNLQEQQQHQAKKAGAVLGIKEPLQMNKSNQVQYQSSTQLSNQVSTSFKRDSISKTQKSPPKCSNPSQFPTFGDKENLSSSKMHSPSSSSLSNSTVILQNYKNGDKKSQSSVEKMTKNDIINHSKPNFSKEKTQTDKQPLDLFLKEVHSQNFKSTNIFPFPQNTTSSGALQVLVSNWVCKEGQANRQDTYNSKDYQTQLDPKIAQNIQRAAANNTNTNKSVFNQKLHHMSKDTFIKKIPNQSIPLLPSTLQESFQNQASSQEYSILSCQWQQVPQLSNPQNNIYQGVSQPTNYNKTKRCSSSYQNTDKNQVIGSSLQEELTTAYYRAPSYHCSQSKMFEHKISQEQFYKEKENLEMTFSEEAVQQIQEADTLIPEEHNNISPLIFSEINQRAFQQKQFTKEIQPKLDECSPHPQPPQQTKEMIQIQNQQVHEQNQTVSNIEFQNKMRQDASPTSTQMSKEREAKVIKGKSKSLANMYAQMDDFESLKVKITPETIQQTENNKHKQPMQKLVGKCFKLQDEGVPKQKNREEKQQQQQCDQYSYQYPNNPQNQTRSKRVGISTQISRDTKIPLQLQTSREFASFANSKTFSRSSLKFVDQLGSLSHNSQILMNSDLSRSGITSNVNCSQLANINQQIVDTSQLLNIPANFNSVCTNPCNSASYLKRPLGKGFQYNYKHQQGNDSNPNRPKQSKESSKNSSPAHCKTKTEIQPIPACLKPQMMRQKKMNNLIEGGSTNTSKHASFAKDQSSFNCSTSIVCGIGNSQAKIQSNSFMNGRVSPIEVKQNAAIETRKQICRVDQKYEDTLNHFISMQYKGTSSSQFLKGQKYSSSIPSHSNNQEESIQFSQRQCS